MFEFTLLTLLCGEGRAGPGRANLALLGRHVIVNVNRQGQNCAQGSAASLRLRGARGRYAPANQNSHELSGPAREGEPALNRFRIPVGDWGPKHAAMTACDMRKFCENLFNTSWSFASLPRDCPVPTLGDSEAITSLKRRHEHAGQRQKPCHPPEKEGPVVTVMPPSPIAGVGDRPPSPSSATRVGAGTLSEPTR